MKLKQRWEKTKDWARVNRDSVFLGVGVVIGTMTYHFLETSKRKASTPNNGVLIQTDEEIKINVKEK